MLVIKGIEEQNEEFSIDGEIYKLKNLGYSNKEIVKILKDKLDIPKNLIYDTVIKHKIGKGD